MHLNIGQSQRITVEAPLLWGGDPVLQVVAGEKYHIVVPPGQYWYDSWVKTTPKGFFNPLLWFSGRRVKGVKCFALCGSIGQGDQPYCFYIGDQDTDLTVPKSGNLYFFPNDSKDHYGNNSGRVVVAVRRLG